MTAPLIDPFGAKRRRRMALSSEAPDFTLDDSRVRQALDFGDQTDEVDRMMLPPEQERPATFLGRLGKALPEALGHGLASIDPETDSGLGQFLGEAGRGFLDATDRQRASEEERRQQYLAATKLKGEMFDRQEGVRQFDTAERGRADERGMQRKRLQFETQPEYLQQGYGSNAERDAILHPRPHAYLEGTAPGANREDTFDVVDGKVTPLGITPRPQAFSRSRRPLRETDAIAGTITYRDPETLEVLDTVQITPKETSDAERTAAGQAERLAIAGSVINSTPPPQGFAKRVEGLRQRYGDAGTVEQAVAAGQLSDEDQAFLSAAILFGRTAGYIESGKAITFQEIRGLMNIIPLDTDGPKNAAFKKSIRDKYVSGSHRIAGRAAANPTPDMGGEDAIIDQVMQEHPDWDDAKVLGEVRKRMAPR